MFPCVVIRSPDRAPRPDRSLHCKGTRRPAVGGLAASGGPATSRVNTGRSMLVNGRQCRPVDVVWRVGKPTILAAVGRDRVPSVAQSIFATVGKLTPNWQTYFR